MPLTLTLSDKVMSLEKHVTVRREMSSPLVQPVVTPRFVPTCTPELLSGLGALAAQHGCHVQSHISESLDNDAFVAQLHPEVSHRLCFLFWQLGLLPSRQNSRARQILAVFMAELLLSEFSTSAANLATVPTETSWMPVQHGAATTSYPWGTVPSSTSSYSCSCQCTPFARLLDAKASKTAWRCVQDGGQEYMHV